MSAALLGMQALFQSHMLGTADASRLVEAGTPCREMGLAIYAHAYRRRLVDALADAYAKTRALMGDPVFELAAAGYIAANPPTLRNLRWFGGGLAQYLAQAWPERAQFAEMAGLDWSLRCAFDGPDSAVLHAGDLADLPPEAWASLRLLLVPTAQLLGLRHNTVAVWQALDDGLPAPPTETGTTAVHWLVWRQDLQPHFRSLSATEALLLRALQAGATFAQACEGASGAGETEVEARIGRCLRQWLEEGVLSGLELPALDIDIDSDGDGDGDGSGAVAGDADRESGRARFR